MDGANAKRDREMVNIEGSTQSDLTQLEEALGALMARLTPIVSPLEDKPEEGLKASRAFNAPLSQVFESFRQRIEVLKNGVNDVLNRLEI